MQLPSALTTLAEAQHGVVSVDQMYLSGASEKQVYRWRRDGTVDVLSEFVLRVPGSSRTVEQAAMTVVLDAGPGAVLSHTSALALWRVPGFRLTPHHVLQPRAGILRRKRMAIVHTSRTVPPAHVRVLLGIPVTSPTRSLFDAGPLIHPERLERAVDNVWAMHLTTGPLLHDMFRELTSPGRNTRNMRAILDTRPPSYVPPASGLEKRFHWILESDGQPPMSRQSNLGDDEQWLGRVDAFDVEAKLIVEVNSDRYHTALLDQAADARRQKALEEAGFEVEAIDEDAVWFRPREVARRVWSARQAGRRSHGAPLLVRRGAA